MQPYEQNPYAIDTGAVRTRADVDQGLRAFMLGVYNHMVLGLAISALTAIAMNYLSVAFWIGSKVGALTPFGVMLYSAPMKWVVMFAPLAMIFFIGARSQSMSARTAAITFYLFSVLMGVSLSSILLVFTKGSIVQVFFITAAAFGSLSLWGYTTKKDISGWGTFLFMGLVGLIIASIVNIFLGSSATQFAISVIGVLIFAGFTAWDTQQLKTLYLYGDLDKETAAKESVFGALSLYLDFVNLFSFLLNLLGSRE